MLVCDYAITPPPPPRTWFVLLVAHPAAAAPPPPATAPAPAAAPSPLLLLLLLLRIGTWCPAAAAAAAAAASPACAAVAPAADAYVVWCMLLSSPPPIPASSLARNRCNHKALYRRRFQKQAQDCGPWLHFLSKEPFYNWPGYDTVGGSRRHSSPSACSSSKHFSTNSKNSASLAGPLAPCSWSQAADSSLAS